MGIHKFLMNVKIVILFLLYIIFFTSFLIFSFIVCDYIGDTILLNFFKTHVLFNVLSETTLLTIVEVIVASTYIGICLYVFDKYPREFLRNHTTKILKTYDKHIFYNDIKTVKKYEDLEELETYNEDTNDMTIDDIDKILNKYGPNEKE